MHVGMVTPGFERVPEVRRAMLPHPMRQMGENGKNSAVGDGVKGLDAVVGSLPSR